MRLSQRIGGHLRIRETVFNQQDGTDLTNQGCLQYQVKVSWRGKEKYTVAPLSGSASAQVRPS